MPTLTLPFRFAGQPPRHFTAKFWPVRNHDHPFAALPAHVTSLVVPPARCIFVNRQGDKRVMKLTLDEARNWKHSEFSETEIIFAQARSGTSKFCIRLIFNADKVIQDANSNSWLALARLIEDAKFHSTHLVPLEGQIVPIHYGMWLMDTGAWGGKVFFSVTQWCGVSFNELSYTKFNTEANRILVGRTFEILHDSGIHLGGLGDFINLRHAVIDVGAPGLSEEDLLNGKAPCYIVGFSEALANHQCKLPVVPLGSFPRSHEVGCDEIESAIILLGFAKKSAKPVPLSRALEWHAKYSELYPDESNASVAVAQRHRLYPGMRPVYGDQLLVSFRGDDEYAKADIWQNPDFCTDDDADDLEAAKEQTPDRVGGFRSDSSSPDPHPSEPGIIKSARTTLDFPSKT
ncbi:hypothetical protein C8R47DRAFT_153663 [Mycena vitilis]|nr:hypothetical protein C8R47DRAFT_153663 [Mycena vitilis]